MAAGSHLLCLIPIQSGTAGRSRMKKFGLPIAPAPIIAPIPNVTSGSVVGLDMDPPRSIASSTTSSSVTVAAERSVTSDVASRLPSNRTNCA